MHTYKPNNLLRLITIILIHLNKDLLKFDQLVYNFNDLSGLKIAPQSKDEFFFYSILKEVIK